MFKIGIAGIIITVLLGYLRHDFVKRWIRNALNLESNWWIDAVSFLLIAVAGFVTFYVLNQTQNAREIAEEKVVALEGRTVALNPYRQNITDFSATVSIVVKSNGEWKANMPGVFVWFTQGEEKLIALTAIETMTQNLNEYVKFYAKTTHNLGNTLLGKPIALLKNIEIINIYVPVLPDNAEILGGELSCIINGGLSLPFLIPAQRANRTEIMISELQGSLQVLNP